MDVFAEKGLKLLRILKIRGKTDMIGKIFSGIKGILKIIIYVILAKIFSAIVIAIGNELSKKVEHNSELIHSTSDTISLVNSV